MFDIDSRFILESDTGFKELGATSAPLMSMAYFIGDFCKEFNEDFMLCKTENHDPRKCLLEGRKVTRCAMDVLSQLQKECGSEFKNHWDCLDFKNHQYQSCRDKEKQLNSCALKLNFKKSIPDTEKNQPPIHLRENPIYK